MYECILHGWIVRNKMYEMHLESRWGDFPLHVDLREEERMRGQEKLWCGIMKDWRENQGEFLEKGEANSLTQLKSPRPNVHTVWKQQSFSPFQKHVFPSPGILLWHISLLWGRSISVSLFTHLWGQASVTASSQQLNRVEISKRTMSFHHVPFLSSRAKANEAGMWVCDTVCVWADVCIKTNKKSIKGNIPALLQKHEEASIERGRQWLQCLTTELLSGHKGPLVPPPPSMGVCPEWASVCWEEHGDLGEIP